jgi:hypothetical protein
MISAATEYGFCFRPERGRRDCSGRLSLWIDHRGETRFVPTSYDVRFSEWNAVSGTFDAGGVSPPRRMRLRRYSRGMARDLNRVERIVRDLRATNRDFTTEDITKCLTK